MRDYELPPREESDPYNRDRGQVSQADLIADWRELWLDDGDLGEWEAGQMAWLRQDDAA